MHDRGNKPDAHQQPEEKHATDNTLTVCVIFGGEPANSANNQRAYYALTQYGKDNQWYSCHPFPILHFLRISQITSGIAGRAAVGVRFDNDIGFCEMRARQWRDGSQSAVLLAQLFNWTELKCTQRARFDTYGLFPSATRK